jgi:redox-sensitive bicupin YhaK (pirin superfamily)
VFLDHFGPMEKVPGRQGVPPHPHAGIATITYLFSGTNRHQDSKGNDAMVFAGDLAWMQAGKGIVHAEGMNEHMTAPVTVHGLQLWISLPAKDKFIEPDFWHYKSADLPKFEFQGAEVKVICGSLEGHISPVKSLSPAFIFEVKMGSNQEINIPIAKGDSCGMYVIGGTVLVDGHELKPDTITAFGLGGDGVVIKANEASHFVMLGGTPLNEPIFPYGSFVMNTKEQMRQVLMDYDAGLMGEIE